MIPTASTDPRILNLESSEIEILTSVKLKTGRNLTLIHFK